MILAFTGPFSYRFFFMLTEFLCISVLRVASGLSVDSCKSALNLPVVYFDALTELGAFMRTQFLCVSVLREASGPRVKLASCKSALTPPSTPTLGGLLY